MPQQSGPRSVPQILRTLSGLNLQSYQGKILKTPQVHQAFQGLLTIDEIKALRQFLSSQKAQDIEDDIAVVDSASDYMDMDDMIEAIQFKQHLEERPPV